MYKCSECGAEYEIKPDYCDCGNDTFVETEQLKPKQNFENNNNTNFKTEIPKIKLSANKSAEISKPTDFISLGIFMFFIIISLVVVFYPVKETQTQQLQDKTISAQTDIQEIPSVETFWDNSVEEVIQEDKVSETENTQEEYDPIAIKLEKWLNRPSRTEDNTIIPQNQSTSKDPVKVKPVQTSKTDSVKQQNVLTQKNSVQTVSQNTTKKTEQKVVDNSSQDLIARVQRNAINATNNTTQAPKNYAVSIPKQTQTQVKPQSQIQNQGTSQIPNTAVNQQIPQTKPQLRNLQYQEVKSSEELAKELSSYKAALRNNIGKKINFTNVVGDGNCSVTFKVDSTGKLLNRNFAQQSSNITLNDAVFSAMKSTTSFNPPPEGYKNETMTFSVKIYNGNFEITLK